MNSNRKNHAYTADLKKLKKEIDDDLTKVLKAIEDSKATSKNEDEEQSNDFEDMENENDDSIFDVKHDGSERDEESEGKVKAAKKSTKKIRNSDISDRKQVTKSKFSSIYP